MCSKLSLENHVVQDFKMEAHCFPKIAETPAANPPTIPVTKINKYEFPSRGNSVAIFLDKVKSLALLNQNA